MPKNKKGELSFISLLSLLFGTVIIVSAQVLNFTDNSSVNITLNETLNISFINQSVNLNQSIENITQINESIITNKTINVTILIENLTLNQSINLTLNETINITLPEKPIKNLTKIVELNKNKLNIETEKYLKNIKDKKEVKDYIIKFRSFIDENKLVNVTLDKKIEKFKVTKIKGEAEDIEDLIEDNEIEFIELEQDVKVLEENIPFNIKKVKADSVWNFSNGSGIKVAILDTGISLHNDLSIAGGVSFVDNNYFDSNGHGTSVAGVIASLLNNEGLAGAAPDVSLYSVKIMQSSTGYLSNAIAGIEWTIDNNIYIVSMSFGFEFYSQIFKEVLQEAYNNNILLVAASGNNGQDNILYPAKYDSVIAVGAVTKDNNLASFSSYGVEQELVAPGVEINSTSLGNSYSISSGSSLAAPHVAGVAALIKSFNSSLTNEQIRAKLRNDALDLGQAGKDDLFGYGLVQANLQTTNFTLINLSYFYEIFNISNFGLPNITFTFWLNGTGTIDDVSFLPGYYLVNITFNDESKKSFFNKVLENGSIFLLTTSLSHRDFFETDGGSSSDNIAWINDNITVKITTTVPTPEAECYRIDGGAAGNRYSHCFFDTSAHKTECDNNSADIECGPYTNCNTDNLIGLEQEILDYASARSGSSEGRIIDDCTSAGVGEGTGTTSYYVVDRKSARCTNDTHYNISGWHGTNWIIIAQSTCGSGYRCINSSNFTTESAYINPCISETTCTGTIQVITEDRNGNPISNLLVSRDLTSNKTTNSVGVAEYSLSKTCNQDMEFKVYCSNSSGATLCGTKTAKLDVVNDYEGLLFDCSICSGSPDMQIDVDNVRTNKAASNVTVNISLSGSVSSTNINLTLKIQGKDGLISREASQLFDISGGSFKALNQTITINDNDDFLHVYVDTINKVSESNEKNNYALVPLFEKQIDVYFDIDVGYASVNNEIKKYIKLFVNEETNQNLADVILCVGKKCSNFNSLNSYTLYNFQKIQKFGYKNNKIVFEGKDVGTNKPYNSIVGGFKSSIDGKKYIMAYGVDIDGDIASVKKLVSAKDLFFNPDLLLQDRTKVIDDYDLTGISVFDLLHSKSNLPYYNQRGSDNFANIVSRILNNNNFEISIKTVKTYNDNTTLRLKNVNTDYSQNFRDAIVGNAKPVVLARGLWSSLLSWESFSRELAFDKDNARDTWLIEIIGGDTTECDTCANYNYNDLVDYYWPAFITGVQNYSTQKILDYVGFSNGCRVALSSLSNYSRSGKNNSGYVFDSSTGNYLASNLGSKPVDIFIGVGCPGAFVGQSFFKKFFGNHGGAINRSLSNKNHITAKDVAQKLINECSKESLSDDRKQCKYIAEKLAESDESYKISRNLANDYLGFIKSNTDAQPVYNNLNLTKGYFIYGILNSLANLEVPVTSKDFNQDGVVTSNDSISMANLLITNNYDKTKQYTNIGHSKLPNDKSVKEFIKGVLK